MKTYTKHSSVINLGRLLFLRDFRYLYRQTFLGGWWAVIRVILSGLPFIMVGRHFELGPEDPNIPYVVYAFIGFILWHTISEAVIYPQWIAYRLRAIVRDAPFPHESIIVAGAIYALFHTLVYSLLGVLVLVMYQVLPSPTALLMILIIPSLTLVGLALGIFFVPFTYLYIDSRFALPFLSMYVVKFQILESCNESMITLFSHWQDWLWGRLWNDSH